MYKKLSFVCSAAVLSAGLGVVAAPQKAQAQSAFGVPNSNSVMFRPRPDYDPRGIRTGAFIVYPRFDAGVGFDDNVFEQEDNEEDDFIYTLAPRVDVVSQWARHRLVFTGSSDTSIYNQNGGEDRTNWNVGTLGVLDITRSTRLGVTAGYREFTEDRSSPDSPNTAEEPTPISSVAASVALDHEFNRLRSRTSYEFETFDYDDVNTPLFGTINNDDRDYQQSTVTQRFSYEFSPGYVGFVEGSYNTVDYADGLDDNGVDRDSSGYQAVGGVTYELTNVLTGDAFVGYVRQGYDSSTLPAVDGITFGSSLYWFPSELLTTNLTIQRTVAETTITDGFGNVASGSLNTEVIAGFDYEFRRNVIVSGELSFGNADFEGVGRKDDTRGFSLGARYMINRNLSVNGEYRFRDRNSNVPTEDFSQNTLMFSVRTQL